MTTTSKKDKEEDGSKGKTPENFIKKLKSVCTNCTTASMMVYFRNIRRLYRLIEEEKDITLTGDWLGKTQLIEKYKKPLKCAEAPCDRCSES